VTEAVPASAVVIGASGGVGAAVVEALKARGRHAAIHALSRSGTGLDLEDEGSIRAAAQVVAQGPAPDLVFVATGILHDGFAPERSWRALEPEHLLRDYRVNAIGPALVAKHFLPLAPRDRRFVFAALSARVGSIGDNRLGGWHAYRASKAALNMILRNLAIETARTHKQAVIAGPGVSSWSRYTMGLDVEYKQLTGLDVVGSPVERSWLFAYPVGKQPPVLAQGFMDFMRKVARPMIYDHLSKS